MNKLYRKKVPFTQVPNEIIYDNRLSAQAKGVALYLFSRPDGWNFNSVEITKHFTNGKDSIRASLRELEAIGYLRRIEIRDGGNGRFSHVDYELLFSINDCGKDTDDGNPVHGGKPVDGKSVHGEPVGGCAAPNNTINNNKEKNNTETTTSPLFPPSSSVDGRGLEVEGQELICSFTEKEEKEESAKAFGEQETEYRRNSTKPCHLGDVGANPTQYTGNESKALKTANFGATVAEMETDRQKARKSLRRIFGNYPKRSQGIPISLFDLFYAERLWEVEGDIIDGINKWVKSSQWRKDCGRYIPAFQKFIEQEIWRYEPQEEEHKEVRADEVTATTENFEKFWAMFPDCRKIAKEKTIQTWNECGAEKVAGTILSQLAKDSKEQSWTKEGGKFSPSPRRYLVEKRWQDKLINGKTEEEHLRDIEEEKNRQFQERRKAFFERMGAKQCKF